MKISVFVNKNPFFESSAIANRYAGQFKALAKRGEEVTLYVLYGGKDHTNAETDGVLKIKYGPETPPAGSGKFAQLKEMLFGKRLSSNQIEWLKKSISEPTDCVWLAGSGAIRHAFVKLLPKVKAIKLIEFSEFQQLYKEEKTFFLRRWQFWREYKDTLKVIKEVDVISVMTKTLENYYRKLALSSTKFVHIPMTVDFTRFQGEKKESKYSFPYIAFTGTYTDRKDGVSILIEAFAKIADKYPSLHLLLAGFQHPDMEGQKALIRKYNLQERISHIGMIDKTEVPSFICNACLLALSRPDSHQAQGGFPTKLGEYLATGNPVCVTRVGEIPDYLEDNVSAFMAEPGNVDSFADAMDRALSNPENAKRVGENGRVVAETRFNADIQAKSLYDFLSRQL